MSVLVWVCFGVGAVCLLATWASVIGSLIVPRALHSNLSRLTAGATSVVFGLLTKPKLSYVARDRILAWQSPMSLLVRLVVWVALFDFSFTLMLLPFVDGDLWRAGSEAGSAMFTLGYAAPTNLGNTILVYAAAYTGLVVVALQIGYLPTLYAAFNKREEEVTLLVSRAGSPSWGPELLVRTRFGMATQDSSNELAELYQHWERWAAAVAESHSAYLTLVWFRSPAPYSNWLISLISVMDAAALQLSLSPSTVPNTRARLVLRMGFTCLNQVARAVGIAVDEDADPDAPLDITFDEFAAAVVLLESVDFPVEVTAEQAWPHFRGWRVNYERVAYQLAYAIDAPPAKWSGSRRFAAEPIVPFRPQNRTASGVRPDDPQMIGRRTRAPDADSGSAGSTGQPESAGQASGPAGPGSAAASGPA
ncbi:hypothetical protein [Subtercola endophyticus]|uniref:hypothetical protein n=1 Tax=Subtercola endophyticus TaxID=2895559 RepID=UPI001E2F6A52|nr:hypothetical protein [Subtercola endophyticus]UFS60169.1 hypothetical protein LQ955_05260 [Subtercola endophyticus]